MAPSSWCVLGETAGRECRPSRGSGRAAHTRRCRSALTARVSRLVIVATLSTLALASAVEYRTFDGIGNNVAHATWGAVNSTLMREGAPNSYTDGVSSYDSSGPKVRLISNRLFGLLPNVINKRSVSALTNAWGQFIAHDILKTGTAGAPVEFQPLPGDPDVAQSFYAVRYDARPGQGGVHSPINYCSSFLDGSVIYGATVDRAHLLRSFSGGRMLSDSFTGLPWATGVPGGNTHMDPGRGDQLLAGDSRANVNPGLLAIQGVWVLEHNRWAGVLAAQNPSWHDERLYQEARRRVIAELQIVTFQEYLPAVLGRPAPAYTGYKPDTDPTAGIFFAAVGFRYGHSSIRAVYNRYDPSGAPFEAGPVLLRDVIFRPTNWVKQGGVMPLMLGMVLDDEMAVDVAYIEDVRNHLGFHGAPDLAALDIFRGRDAGMPTYVQVRQHLGLPVPNTFADITTNTAIISALKELYPTVNDIDAIVGALCEPNNGTGLISGTFAKSVLQEYVRIRDGDRFWYQNNQFSTEELASLQSTTWADIVRRAFPEYVRFPHPSFYTHTGALAAVAVDGGAGTGGTVDDSVTQSGVLELSSVYSARWQVVGGTLTTTLTYKISHCSNPAWLGMGIGFNMFSADMAVCQWTGSSMTCVDRTSSDLVAPVADTDAGGTNDVIVLSHSCDSALSVTFQRPTGATNDDVDKPIQSGQQSVIFAYNEASVLAYHGRNRFVASIDFSSGASIVLADTTRKIYVIHGVAMFVAWGMIAPAGVFVMRFCRHKPYWLAAHKSLMSLTVSITVIAALAAVASSDQSLTLPHHVVGSLVLGFCVLQALLGAVIKFFHNRMYPPGRFVLMRRAHRWLGYCIFLSASANMYIGFGELASTQQYLMGLWVACVIFGMLVYDWHFKFEGRRQKAVPVAPPVVVTLTARQVVRQVGMGAKWVILDGRLYDVSSFIDQHPGGSYLLNRCIGCDVTSMFGGKTSVDANLPPHQHTFRAAAILTTLCVGTLVDDSDSESDDDDVDGDDGVNRSSRARRNGPGDDTEVRGASRAKSRRRGSDNVASDDPLWMAPQQRANALVGTNAVTGATNSQFHPWTVTHTQWVTAPSRPKPVKLLMLMPPLMTGFDIPFSYKHFGKHMHTQVTLESGQVRVSPFSLVRWGPANPHTTQMPGSITLMVRRYPNGSVTPLIHNLKPGDTLKLSGPHGLGFRLSSRTRGVMVGFAQGTGVIAFIDLIQHLVDQQRAEEDRGLEDVKVEEAGSAFDGIASPNGDASADGVSAEANAQRRPPARFHSILSRDDHSSSGASSATNGSRRMRRIDTASTTSSANVRMRGGLSKLYLHLVCLFGSKEDAVCLDWLEASAKLAGLRVRLWVNLEKGKKKWAAGGKHRLVGPMREGTVRKVLSSVKDVGPLSKIWVCGKPEFSQSMFAKLPGLGVPISKIQVL